MQEPFFETARPSIAMEISNAMPKHVADGAKKKRQNQCFRLPFHKCLELQQPA
jgi:hypothetical protein